MCSPRPRAGRRLIGELPSVWAALCRRFSPQLGAGLGARGAWGTQAARGGRRLLLRELAAFVDVPERVAPFLGLSSSCQRAFSRLRSVGRREFRCVSSGRPHAFVVIPARATLFSYRRFRGVLRGEHRAGKGICSPWPLTCSHIKRRPRSLPHRRACVARPPGEAVADVALSCGSTVAPGDLIVAIPPVPPGILAAA